MWENFFEEQLTNQLLTPLVKKLVVLEIEGKFKIRRPKDPTQKLTRLDKFMDMSLATL